MSSLRQIEANRRNAQRSTGPRTPEGRAAARLNGVRHGLTAHTIVLPGESVEDFEALIDSLEAEFEPSTTIQVALVQDMALCAWRLRRLYNVEGAFHHMRLEEDAKYRDEYHPGLDHHGKIAYVVKDSDNAQSLSNMARYEAHLKRGLHKSLQALDRLKAQERRSAPRPEPAPIREIGFASQSEPEPEPGPSQTPDLKPAPQPAPTRQPIGFASQFQSSPQPGATKNRDLSLDRKEAASSHGSQHLRCCESRRCGGLKSCTWQDQAGGGAERARVA